MLRSSVLTLNDEVVMFWTTNRIQLLLALTAVGMQSSAMIEAIMDWAGACAEVVSAVGVVRRTRVLLFHGLGRQKRTVVLDTALLTLARMELRRVWWASLLMGEESHMINSLWVFVKAG